MLSQKRWRLERVLELFMVLLVSYFIGVLLVSVLNWANWLNESEKQLTAVIVSMISFHGVALALTYLFLRTERMTWNEAFGILSPRLSRALLLAFLVACGAVPIAWSLGEVSAKLMHLLHLKPVVQDPVQILQTSASATMKVFIGCLAIVVAPLAEELVFRGLLYPTIRQCGFPRLALWGTSVLFAAIHFNLAVLLPLTFLAVVWTLLYETTGNVLAPILAHSLFNFVNFMVVSRVVPHAGPS
jgi:membrane protease YdiL (CAAX protease family)